MNRFFNKTILIFRHGETDWNRERRLQGNSDIPLNALGKQQALALREYFANHPVDVFLSSDLQRAHETAKIAAGDSGIEVVIDRRLRETHLGQAEGLLYSEIVERFGQATWDSWYSLGPETTDARFPGGESKAEHVARLLECLEGFLRATSHARIAVASHGGAMRRLIHHLRPELTTPISIANCVLYEMTYDVALASWAVDLTPKAL
jgi:broad specificity phosphatase PhoE